LGWAFKNTTSLDNRQELLVFITPRSVRVRGSEDLASLPSGRRSMAESRQSLSRCGGMIFSAVCPPPSIPSALLSE
jgi:type II secretory pathway component GspD/PulD (secretin)